MKPEANSTSVQSREKTPTAEISSAFQALVELFANIKGHTPYRRYLLERIDGELVFRQTETDAAVEDAIANLSGQVGGGRRIIRLP